MRLFGNLAVYMGLGFLMSFIVNKQNIFLVVSILMFIIGIIINTLVSRKNKDR